MTSTDPPSPDQPADQPALQPVDLGDDPVAAFAAWFGAAQTAGAPLPEAVALATVSAAGEPSVRMVLLRGADTGGFRFFTNYESAKARDLDATARAALVFHWTLPTHRQVRVSGAVERLTREESEAYFASRSPRSRVSAWASPQSRPVADRAALEALWAAAGDEHGSSPPLPRFWGGYRVIPERVEFWQGRRDRLHDRINFRRDGTEWIRERLAP